MKKKLVFKEKYISYLIIIAMFAASVIMIKTGTASRKLQSWLVPICINIRISTMYYLWELFLLYLVDDTSEYLNY